MTFTRLCHVISRASLSSNARPVTKFLHTTMPKSTSETSSGDCLRNYESQTLGPGTKVPPPSEWKTLETQVGGHQFAHGEYDHQTLGVVDLGNGLILKSLQNPPRGPRELGFYQKVFDPNCDDPDLLELRQFLPSFHGTEEKGTVKFLKLANLTSGFKHPCVIDLKMGRVTYDQEATPEKIAHEVEKYPPLKKLGYQITGMMMYNPETQSNETYDKSYSRHLTEDNIVTEGLSLFFQLQKNNPRRDAIQTVVSKLKKLESWFLKQQKLSFIASSLLIVYEGSRPTKKIDLPVGMTDLSESNTAQDGSHSISNTHSDIANDGMNKLDVNVHVQKRINDGQEIFHDEGVKKVRLSDAETANSSQCSNMGNTQEAQVHLIDFAHVFPASGIDQNFLFGLQKLITSLESLIN